MVVFVPYVGHCAGKYLNTGATELTLKVLLLVSRNWKKRKAKRRKKDRKLRKNGEKERGSVKGNEKGENGNEKGKENVNEKKRRNGSGNENEIGIVTGQKRETGTGTVRETETAIGNGARIGTRIGVDRGKAWWKLPFTDALVELWVGSLYTVYIRRGRTSSAQASNSVQLQG